MKCVICGYPQPKLIYSRYPGYVEGSAFDIFACNKCSTHFVNQTRIAKKIYECIYLNRNVPGYDRYYNYIHQVKKSKNPLKSLANSELTFFPIYNYLRNKSNLDILDVGCGYGYLTYALNRSGHKAIGIDISENAVRFALNNFSDCFLQTDIRSFAEKTKEKFDLIIAAEIFEHSPRPNKFIQDCLKILKRNGKIIIITPSKDYMKKESIWQTELPPVHITWLSHESFENISRIHNLNLKFVTSLNVMNKENNLLNFFLTRRETMRPPSLTRDGKTNLAMKRQNPSIIRRILRQFLIDFSPVRYSFNLSHKLLVRNDPLLAVILGRRNAD